MNRRKVTLQDIKLLVKDVNNGLVKKSTEEHDLESQAKVSKER